MLKKNISLSDIQKYELCLYARDNKKTRTQYVDWVEQKWGVRVNESTITRTLQSKEKRLTTELANPEAKHHKPVAVPKLELALKEFVLCYQHKTILSDAILIEKAKLLANELEVPQGTLQFSNGWLQKFKECNSICQVKLHGEANSADENAITEALPLLQNKCAEYPPDQPDRTLATKQLSERKKSKERLSVALCANADGSHKLPPLIIGKYANPRCFKNVNIGNLPMSYQNNAKAWMLATIFQKWLQEFDYQVGIKHNKQRVLLLLDNCTSHKINNLVLENVEIYFLPPNTTSKLQPMNSGIIMSFKKHYRHHHIRWILEQVEAGQLIQNLKMNVLQAIQYIIQGWNEVTADTIKNCWNHVKILSDAIPRDNDENDDSNIDSELNRAIEALHLSDMMQVKEFLTIPEEDVIYEFLNISEFEDMFKSGTTDHPDEVDDISEMEIIHINEALRSLKTVNLFLLQQENAGEQIKLAGKIEKFIRKRKFNSMQQTTINQYFV
ncbi:unnamed protein product [Rhizophagus irregularis]|uniref:HTH CENPB-type domain-containing protein n=1 Tax=Rhizophagus irregularis TaxID=588596 RepID=A0A916EB15_9GLOM|nr:unnamed protein product [Rhizophagus irregularis]